jgi:hypothetical protein
VFADELSFVYLPNKGFLNLHDERELIGRSISLDPYTASTRFALAPLLLENRFTKVRGLAWGYFRRFLQNAASSAITPDSRPLN